MTTSNAPAGRRVALEVDHAGLDRQPALGGGRAQRRDRDVGHVDGLDGEAELGEQARVAAVAARDVERRRRAGLRDALAQQGAMLEEPVRGGRRERLEGVAGVAAVPALPCGRRVAHRRRATLMRRSPSDSQAAWPQLHSWATWFSLLPCLAQ